MTLKAYLINLSWNTDRLRFCRKEYAFLGDSLSITKATEGKSLNKSWLEENTTEQVIVNVNDENYPSLNLSAIGCADSHRRIWKRIAEEGIDYALVLEDDSFLCVTEADFAELTQTLLAAKMDLCLLGCSLRGAHKVHVDSKLRHTNIAYILPYQEIGRTGGAYAYFISKRCAAILTKDLYPKIDREADDFARLSREHPELNLSIAWPPVIHSSLFDTEIWIERRHLKGAFKRLIYSFIRHFKFPRLVFGTLLRKRFSKLVVFDGV